MHSLHKPYADGLIIQVHKFPTTEEIMDMFPHVVQHDVRFASAKWRQMCWWLRGTIGERDQTWSWLISSQLRFQNEPDAMLFSVTWS